MTRRDPLAGLKRRFATLPRPVLLGLDVDGTLARIVRDPSKARVPDGTQTVLRKLAKRDDYRVALITGRDLPALKRMARVPGAWRAVEHGGRIVRPGERARAPKLTAEEKAKLDAFTQWASQGSGHVEHKARSVALHVRRLGADTARERLAAAKKVAKESGLIAREGRAVLEAELESGDKGVALTKLHELTGAESVFFAGDDLTDLPAIRYAKSHGIGVFIKSAERPQRPKQASFAIDGPDALAAFLRSILE
ncbi:MAG: trehalose-phosphatase [Deltaproteobacteria bacterium]|nr:trehalose-phosphatase [Deltaproteobacteria bacterium]